MQMKNLSDVRVNIVSSGHNALDHRIFDKEARTLAAEGASVRVIAWHDKEETIEGIHIVPIPKWRTRPDRFLFVPWRALAKGLKYPADVWHIQDPEMLLICPVLRLIRPGLVIFYDRHEDFALILTRREWIPSLLRGLAKKIFSWLEHTLVGTTDGVVTVSRYLAEDFPEKSTVAVYNFPTGRFVQRAKESAPSPVNRLYDVVHLGTLDTRERLSFLIATLDWLRLHRENFSALVIGVEPVQKEELENHFFDARVRVEARVPYLEVPALLVQARIGLHSCPIILDLIGGIPVKVIEFMACGCSVVSIWLPELAELINSEMEGSVMLLRTNDPQDYARVVDKMLNEMSALERNSKMLIEQVQRNIVWEKEGARLVDFYKTALHKRGYFMRLGKLGC